MTEPEDDPLNSQPEPDQPPASPAADDVVPADRRAMPAHRKMSLAMLGMAVVVAIIATVYLFNSGGKSTPQFASSGIDPLTGQPTVVTNTGVLDPARPAEGKKAPDFALVDARDPSKILKLSDFEGKPIVLNFYASWCIPCQEEIPEFRDAQAALASQVQFIGVDYLESSDKALSILDKFKAPYPAMLDSNGLIADHYRVSDGLPQTFFIDKDGILRTQLLGGAVGPKLTQALASIGVTYNAPATPPAS
ncbi:MAG TPA: TlpA disulfide reductase family protein [Tepidiformaceae bacterium]|nr:TlpA disulfide reductase family protein [Tepidiformaceae bacterium]